MASEDCISQLYQETIHLGSLAFVPLITFVLNKGSQLFTSKC